MLRRLISPTRTRARIFDEDASLLLDSRYLYTSGQVLRFDLPSTEPDTFSFDDRIWAWFNRLFQRRDLPLYREPPGADGTIYPEVMNALTGSRGAIVRVNEKGELIVSVAVPIQRFRAVLGVLLLSTQAGDMFTSTSRVPKCDEGAREPAESSPGTVAAPLPRTSGGTAPEGCSP